MVHIKDKRPRYPIIISLKQSGIELEAWNGNKKATRLCLERWFTFESIRKTGFIANGTTSKYECFANGFDANFRK